MPETLTVEPFAARPAALLPLVRTEIAPAVRLEPLPIPFCHRYYEIGKRIADVILGLIALAMSLPILAVCAAMVRLSSRGPVVYRQVRVGRNGRLFRMYKLRTMYDNAEAATGAVWASDNDPRVLPCCRWMRRSHLDELPQLINVLKGEMSLVGPRPERPEILQNLRQIYPDINKRHAVLPGITGLAQIRNGYDKTIESARRKLANDVEYIERRCWSLDARLIAATFLKFYDKQAH